MECLALLLVICDPLFVVCSEEERESIDYVKLLYGGKVVMGGDYVQF